MDKLVVTIPGEHGFPNGLGIINSVTFAGQPMAAAIKLENGQTACREGVAGIFYLDNPSQYGDPGNIVFSSPDLGAANRVVNLNILSGDRPWDYPGSAALPSGIKHRAIAPLPLFGAAYRERRNALWPAAVLTASR